MAATGELLAAHEDQIGGGDGPGGDRRGMERGGEGLDHDLLQASAVGELGVAHDEQHEAEVALVEQGGADPLVQAVQQAVVKERAQDRGSALEQLGEDEEHLGRTIVCQELAEAFHGERRRCKGGKENINPIGIIIIIIIIVVVVVVVIIV